MAKIVDVETVEGEMSEYELSPCPFCGQSDYLSIEIVNRPWAFGNDPECIIECAACAMEMRFDVESIEEAVELWNNRAEL